MPSTYSKLRYHIVFSTKYREPLIAPEFRQRLYDYFGGCMRTAGGVLADIGGTADHVHMYAGLKPTQCLADIVRDLKRATSSWIHEALGIRAFGWQDGYAGFTVTPNDCAGLIEYIRGQQEHHRTRTFEEELVALLNELGIEYDPRYLL